jgi:hypothetical protein
MRPLSPLPVIAALNEDDSTSSEIGRGSAAAAALKSGSLRSGSSSRTGRHDVGDGGKGRVRNGGKLTLPEVNGHALKKTSLLPSRRASKEPLAMEVGEEVDADGDAEAEAEAEIEIEAELDGVVGK